MGGKSESVLGAAVGSAKTVEQLISGVGVLRMIGCSTMSGEVEVAAVSDAQAVNMTILIVINARMNIIFFIYGYTACCNCLKFVIHEMALTKSASESLCSRKARTAGPTGSVPAAPPGESA